MDDVVHFPVGAVFIEIVNGRRKFVGNAVGCDVDSVRYDFWLRPETSRRVLDVAIGSGTIKPHVQCRVPLYAPVRPNAVAEMTSHVFCVVTYVFANVDVCRSCCVVSRSHGAAQRVLADATSAAACRGTQVVDDSASGGR